jgi:replicative DNA helicase
MIEKQLIKLLLNKDFYEKNKGKVSKGMFTNGTGNLYETITKAHNKSQKDLTLPEVESLHVDVYNPALTRTARDNFRNLIEEIQKEKDSDREIASEILSSLHKRNIAQQIAVLSTEIFNGRDGGFNDIQNLLDSAKDNLSKEDYEFVTSDIHELLECLKDRSKYKFNLESLAERVGGVGPGNLVVVFARPESGKTAFWVSLVANENGFAHQGAKVVALVNEESGYRTKMRIINSFTGMTLHDVEQDPETASKKWAEIKDNIRIADTVDWNLDKVDSLAAETKPDILVIDQLDKVHVSGNFARTDEKLRAIYTGAREIAKRRDCCILAISQASAEASGKLDISFDMMENSKTGKAAEADLILGIGYRNLLDTDENLRSIAVSKNKMTGWHGVIPCTIIPELSRYDV